MSQFFKQLIFSSLARQLIFGIAVVHAVLMTIFVFDLVERQRDFMQHQSNNQAMGLAATLATNGSSWVLANDLVGIEEIINSQSNYPDLRYAMFIDNRGKLLGYTDREKIGLYIDDKLSQKIFNGNNKTKIIIENDHLIDVASPIKVNDEIIGWARVGISRSSMSDNLKLVTINGLIYTTVAILIGIFFAWLMSKGLTKGIRQLKTAIDQISDGSRDVACELNREDELGDLSHDFNKMLITIKDNENKIIETHEALSQSERKVSQLIDNLRTEYIFYSHKTDGTFTYLSPSIEDVLGYSVEEYMTKYDVYFTNNPINKDAIEYTNKVLNGESIPSYEAEVLHKDGRKRIMEVTESALFDSAGNVVAVEGLSRDITDYKKVEETLRNEKEKFQREQLLLETIINAIPDQIYYKDNHGVYLGSNKAFDQKQNITKSEMTNKTDFDIFSAKRAENNLKICQQLSNSDKPYHEEKIVSDDNNMQFTYDTIHTAFRKESGELLGYIEISRDITELRNKEIELRRSQKMDALGKLTGGIAHDYNNLLGVVIGYAELLSISLTDEKLKVFAEEIMKAGYRGSNLTSKLLAFTRKQTPSAESVNINDILKTDLNILQKTLTARIEIKLDLDASIWNLWLDPGDFQDAILNISINAMHAMPDGGQFTIKTRNIVISDSLAKNNQIPAGEYVHLSLTDTGCGMEDSTRDQLFDPFFTTKGEQGSGLGMSQVFGFVKRSEGYITVDTELDKGSTINLYFKHSTINQQKNNLNKTPLPEQTTDEQTILVVDDEPSLKALATEFLTQNGYTVLQAGNAKEALRLLEENSVDLVISDVIMPEMDGYELASVIQNKYPAIKILLASGFSREDNIKPEHKALAENMLHKPYSYTGLINATKKQLET